MFRLVIITILTIAFSPLGMYLWFSLGTNYHALKNAEGSFVSIIDHNHNGVRRSGRLEKARLELDESIGFLSCRIVISKLTEIPGVGEGMISKTYRPWQMNEIVIE